MIIMRNSTKRIFSRSLSGFLAFLTVLGVFASLSMLPVFAASTSSSEEDESSIQFSTYYENFYTDPSGDADFTTEQKRIDAMELYYTDGDFQLYVDKITGEVALKDTTTGDILFTNPYNISEYPVSDDGTGNKVIHTETKKQLLSQVHIWYDDNGTQQQYYSFADSALLNQIKVKRLNGGVRVEYSIGEEETRTLVPHLIKKERFESLILEPLEVNAPGGKESRAYRVLNEWYDLYDPWANGMIDSLRENMYELYPVIKEKDIAIYALSEANRRELKLIESYIKSYCPKYTFEELDKDHLETNYTEPSIAPANFKMALEYYVTDTGLEVRFPANGLTFDETNYKLTSIDILPYMGAGLTYYKGYTFIPDGSGSITRFEDTTSHSTSGGKVYGEDYAYQQISSPNQEVFRLPVYGVVTTDELRNTSDAQYLGELKNHASGYFAIVSDGDALTTITSENGGKVYCYGTVYCSFKPRPKDSYNLADAISIGADAEYTVVSKRKYTGSFKINYIMLSDTNDEDVDKSKLNPDRTYYDASYVGMAKAYRDYLEKKGDISRITAENAKDSIPLYIETFGVTETDETVLSIPVTVKKALASFDQLKIMSKVLRGELLTESELMTELGMTKSELAESGITPESYAKTTSPITNISYRLKGYTNGGMVSTVPTKVKFEKAAGGNSGFRDFLSFASEKGIGVYPEFDFAYMSDTSLFDGFSYRSDAVKTIDNRYITKRTYDAILQSFAKTDKICISTSVYRDYYEKFEKAFSKVVKDNVTYVSVGSLGSDLNSDFDDDEPYNRNDAKEHTVELLSQLKNKYGKVMVDAGNAYSIPYASVVLNAPLDSSRFLSASETVPFFGMVFHGYVEIAGAPTNMAGDIKYEMLKIIESGATIYMVLSYDNIELLKEDDVLSQYYAIDYKIWKDTLLTQYDSEGNVVSKGLYDILNDALADVQIYRISDHKFVDCNRQLTDSEKSDIAKDAKASYDKKHAELQADYDLAVQRLGDFDFYSEKYKDDSNKKTLVLNGLGLGLDRDRLVWERDNAKTVLDAHEAAGTKEYEDDLKANIDLFIDDGSVVYVEYENGHFFILNYNNFVVEVDWTINGETVKIEIGAKDFFDSNANA